MFIASSRTLSAVAILLAAVASSGCESAGQRTAIGTGVGVVGGALAGAAIGAHGSGGRDSNILAGAIIGAIAGGAVGGGIGYYLDKQAEKYHQIEGVDVKSVPTATVETSNGYVEQPEHLKLIINNEMLFQQGSSALTPEGTQKVVDMAGVMSEYPDTIVIVKGYASAEGDDQSNLVLSQNRADAVAKTLIGAKVAPSRIQAIGMGESNPIASNNTETGRMQNRRVEINVFPTSDVK